MGLDGQFRSRTSMEWTNGQHQGLRVEGWEAAGEKARSRLDDDDDDDDDG